jgi:hypothetical protein
MDKNLDNLDDLLDFINDSSVKAKVIILILNI